MRLDMPLPPVLHRRHVVSPLWLRDVQRERQRTEERIWNIL